jgi:phosphate transport system protein
MSRITTARHLQRDLDDLQRDLLALAGLVEEAIFKAIRALQERDVKLAREVIAGDNQIDTEENHIDEERLKKLALHQPVAGDLRRIASALMISIDEECLKMLALHQPVACDLRRVVSAMMISTDLERMADLADEIAERAIHLATLPLFPVPDRLQRLTDLTALMVRQALASFVNQSVQQARSVIRLDDEVDRYNTELIEEIEAAMKESPELISPGLSMFSVIRHLERIADHATNIAEDVVYLVEGEFVRHRPRTDDRHGQAGPGAAAG